eukprot:GHRR01033796.1.p1 GENE.GHRR01033796.1~~GHRR01033796.1.p1  ORF type:complete len:123 (-),score=33.30 GHRR01033796.1:15-383(-)
MCAQEVSCMYYHSVDHAIAANLSTGTSLLLHYALDNANDVLVAYKQNHRWLTPDHGFPVRIIIPGFIGGRMVKFLEEITVTAVESNNFYHYHDNRVMPPHVDEELAKKEGKLASLSSGYCQL